MAVLAIYCAVILGPTAPTAFDLFLFCVYGLCACRKSKSSSLTTTCGLSFKPTTLPNHLQLTLFYTVDVHPLLHQPRRNRNPPASPSRSAGSPFVCHLSPLILRVSRIHPPRSKCPIPVHRRSPNASLSSSWCSWVSLTPPLPPLFRPPAPPGPPFAQPG